MNPIFDSPAQIGAAPEAAGAQAPQTRRSRRTSKKVQRRRRTVLITTVLAVLLGVGVFAVQVVSPMLGLTPGRDYPGPGGAEVIYELPAGANTRTVAADLRNQDVVASESAFISAVSEVQAEERLMPGTYPLRKQMKASEAVEVLMSPQDQVFYSPIPQNLRQGEVFEKLSSTTKIPVSEFEQLAQDPTQFGLPSQAPSLEGYLAPGEYQFPVGSSAREILAQMVQRTMDELAVAGVQGADDQFRVLTIASIIEAEGSERYYAAIAGAIENRLNKPNEETGRRIESDATVTYGLNRKSYNVTDAEKQDASNPYNTFARPGLPPGPIGSPKMQAITAAAEPEQNPYYFWVTINLDSGETLFAATYEEHQQNVSKYRDWCSANSGRCA